jgi:hypothetical protein
MSAIVAGAQLLPWQEFTVTGGWASHDTALLVLR